MCIVLSWLIFLFQLSLWSLFALHVRPFQCYSIYKSSSLCWGVCFPLCCPSVVQSSWSASSLLITVCAGVGGCACAHVQLWSDCSVTSSDHSCVKKSWLFPGSPQWCIFNSHTIGKLKPGCQVQIYPLRDFYLQQPSSSQNSDCNSDSVSVFSASFR